MTLGRRSHNGNISNFNRKCVSLAKHFELCRCFVWFDWTGWMHLALAEKSFGCVLLPLLGLT